MNNTTRYAIVAALLAATMGVGCNIRDARTFINDTQNITAPRQEAIRGCHTEVLKTNPTAQGLVVVNFTWKKDTGAMENLVVVPGQTTAPAELQTCVTKNLAGLVLAPPDKQDGAITWSYSFTVPH
jgi:hypothetical protein